MTEFDPIRLRELAEKATPGPWFAYEGWHIFSKTERDETGDNGHVADCSTTSDTAEYIAAVSPDVVLALLAEVERRRQVHE